MPLRLIVFLILCGIWGSTWLFIKLGLQDLPPISFAGIRFVVASMILLVIVALRRPPIPHTRKDWKVIAWTGVLSFTFNYGLLFWGERHISSGLSAVLQATIPLFGLLIAHYMLPSEPMTTPKVMGVVLGLIGVGVIFSGQIGTSDPLAVWGSLAIVVGALCAALSNVIVKARAGHIDPAVLSGGQMVFGLVPLLVVGFSTEGSPLRFHWTTMAVLSLLYLAVVGSVVAFILYYWLIRHMAVTTSMVISLITPVVAVLLGMGTIGERVTFRMIAGGAAILCGVGMMRLKAIRINPVPRMSREP
jgi:drug/metabolite transporter (DMT)-like permease